MNLWWKCPNCGQKVDFTDEMEYVFDEEGEADFDPKHGLFFHTITCKCGALWTMSISGMEDVLLNNDVVEYLEEYRGQLKELDDGENINPLKRE
jgi:hypothetical protein